ncbi:DNA cytosine methyltransferase [Methanofollis aquaemaris]|uniref:DNA (cytosine-5-)-methyltransferase n=1 Tax=Methanofollis aquaemaris TaxID=126734 RepID=A0A8A3S4T5_9EURY|nr:DNA cytosine methyltransferase [Methanofollis aquaemaris]QSZ66933.1 DNA cytosine methyltransferase [Methanofollis aquaemaris]
MRALDLFCGAGGLSLGFRDDGFSVTGADINQYSADIFSTNDIGECIEADLTLGSVPGTFDVVMGGPPCRPWSSINTRKRGSLHPDYRLLERFFDHVIELRPHAFLMENVPPMGSDEGFRSLIKKVKREGYSVASQSLKYLDFGAATKRRRLFTVGFRDFGLDAKDFFIRMDRLKEQPITVGQAIEKYEGYAEGKVPDHEWPHLNTIDRYREYYDSGKYGWSKLEYDGYAPSFGNIMKTYILHPRAGEGNFPLRVLSVRETMEIMGFPADFRFPAGMGLSIRYQMVANAVSPIAAQKMARVIREMIESRKYI